MKLLEESLLLFGHNVAFHVYYPFLDYTSCSNKGDKVEGSIVQLAGLYVWFANKESIANRFTNCNSTVTMAINRCPFFCPFTHKKAILYEIEFNNYIANNNVFCDMYSIKIEQLTLTVKYQ